MTFSRAKAENKKKAINRITNNGTPGENNMISTS